MNRNNAQIEIKKLSEELQSSRKNEEKLKEEIQKLIAQSQIDEDCNKSLQVSCLQEVLIIKCKNVTSFGISY